MKANLSPVQSGKDQLSPARTRLFSRVLAGICLLILAFAAVIGLSMMRAASLIYGLSPVRPPRIIDFYSRIVGHDSIVTDFTIQARSGPLQIRMLTPRDLPNAPMIVVVHGFAPHGNQDGMLNILAGRLCRIGLRVVMPNITSEVVGKMSVTEVDDVDDVVRWSALTSGERVSLFGISYSGGMVISAAARPDFANYVKMIFCVAGYNSIDRLGRYYLRDVVMDPDHHPYEEIPPPGSLTPMAFQYLDELVPADDVEPLRAAMGGGLGAEIPQTATLTVDQRTLLDDVLTVKTPEMRTRYHNLLDRHHAELAAISPMGKVNNIRGSLYVLHGYIDLTIPRGEAEWTEHEAAHNPNVKIVITSWMHHAILDLHAPFREKCRVGYFLSQMLDTALRRSPLPPSLLPAALPPSSAASTAAPTETR